MYGKETDGKKKPPFQPAIPEPGTGTSEQHVVGLGSTAARLSNCPMEVTSTPSASGCQRQVLRTSKRTPLIPSP